KGRLGVWSDHPINRGTDELMKHRNIELVFDGLDAFCELYLNDRIFLTAKNMFRVWRIDVRPHLTTGNNAVPTDRKAQSTPPSAPRRMKHCRPVPPQL